MKKTLTGIVVSDKMQKTAVIEVTLWKVLPVIKKRYKLTRKFMANNPDNSFKVGDLVQIVETRPLSKRKNWEIVKKITKEEGKK